MLKQKPYEYQGILARPMPPLERVNALAPSSDFDRAKAQAEYQKRLEALIEDCGVQADSHEKWVDLALVLAERHVPGFSFEAPSATATRQRRDREEMLIISKMTKAAARGLSERNAAKTVAKELNKRKVRTKSYTEGAVARAFRRLKKAEN